MLQLELESESELEVATEAHETAWDVRETCYNGLRSSGDATRFRGADGRARPGLHGQTGRHHRGRGEGSGLRCREDRAVLSASGQCPLEVGDQACREDEL